MKTITIISLIWMLVHSYQAEAQQQLHVYQMDKVKHYTVGAAISVVSTEIMYSRTKKRVPSVLFGVGMGMLAGFAKEVYDSTGKGNRDVKDFLWTSAGAATPSVSLVIHL
jgi:uncharacterized protein YfiM (DUF2279 family)